MQWAEKSPMRPFLFASFCPTKAAVESAMKTEPECVTSGDFVTAVWCCLCDILSPVREFAIFKVFLSASYLLSIRFQKLEGILGLTQLNDDVEINLTLPHFAHNSGHNRQESGWRQRVENGLIFVYLEWKKINLYKFNLFIF